VRWVVFFGLLAILSTSGCGCEDDKRGWFPPEECADGMCENNEFGETPIDGETCDPACAVGEVCRDSVCCAICKTDADCGDGEFCGAGRYCEKDDVQTACTSDQDCPSRECGADGMCAETTRCDVDADCAMGDICSLSGDCVAACANDLSCGAGEVCRDGRCVVGGECTGDADCGAGSCVEGFWAPE